MLKIIFTGPEASGKTTLATAIHRYWIWSSMAKEFARFYLSEKVRTQGKHAYTYEEMTFMAKGQVFAEQNAAHNTEKLLICDTDLITVKIWSQEVFKKCDEHILKMLEGQFNDDNYYWHQRHYFLCSPENIAWQPDPLRENPFDRDRLFDVYEKELQYYSKDYTILRGNFYDRYYTALTKIDEMLSLPNRSSFYD